MVGLTPWFAPVEWASGPPCPLSCGHLRAERMPPGMAAWQAGGSLHKRAPTPALWFFDPAFVRKRAGHRKRWPAPLYGLAQVLVEPGNHAQEHVLLVGGRME